MLPAATVQPSPCAVRTLVPQRHTGLVLCQELPHRFLLPLVYRYVDGVAERRLLGCHIVHGRTRARGGGLQTVCGEEIKRYVEVLLLAARGMKCGFEPCALIVMLLMLKAPCPHACSPHRVPHA